MDRKSKHKSIYQILVVFNENEDVLVKIKPINQIKRVHFFKNNNNNERRFSVV